MALYQKIDDSEKLLFNMEYTANLQLRRGLDKAAERLKQELEERSPDNPKTKTNKYKKSWKINRRYKFMRVLHNTKMVDSPEGEIPLSGILEIEKPHMRKAYDDIVDELTDIILDEIQF